MSTFINKVDAKGRVSVPVTFRQALKGQDAIVVYRSFHEAMLEGCGLDRMETLKQKIEQLDETSAEHDALSTVFAESTQVPIDGDGRVILPKLLLEYAEITDSLEFVGRGPTFQIWQPAAFAAFNEAARVRAAKSRLARTAAAS